MTEGKLRSLIVTIVRKGWGECVIDASCKAGAEGGTIMFGRGTGDHEQQKILGITIEPEKEIVLTVIARDEADGVLAEIVIMPVIKYFPFILQPRNKTVIYGKYLMTPVISLARWINREGV